jgi:hypothetical protein
MSETSELTEFGKLVETFFKNYHVKYLRDNEGKVYSIEIRANNDIFSTAFLRLLFDKVKKDVICFTDDSACRPVVKIIEY